MKPNKGPNIHQRPLNPLNSNISHTQRPYKTTSHPQRQKKDKQKVRKRVNKEGISQSWSHYPPGMEGENRLKEKPQKIM